MRSISELEKTKTELSLALVELDKLERLSLTEKEEKDPKVFDEKDFGLVKSNSDLVARNAELEAENCKIKKEREKTNQDLKQLQTLSSKLQVDIEHINSEKSLLAQIVKNTQGENEVISKVMEKISQDYEELKKAFDSQKCPKDDKILALRKTARALETENELLHEEKMMIGKENDRIRRGLETRLAELEKQEQNHQAQVQKYVQEQQDLKSKLDKSEQEKLTLSVRFTSLEKELENCKTQLNKVQLEKEEVIEEKALLGETLIALKDCKRVVELKFQNSLTEKSKLENRIESLTQQSELLQVKNCSLEERLETLESEKEEQTSILAEIQISLEQKTSFYQSQIQQMQIELSHRLDEVNLIRVEDVEKVRDEYALLFNEKASELMLVREELEGLQEALRSSEMKISDLEYREIELNETITKLKMSPEHLISAQIEEKLENYATNSQLLQFKFKEIHKEFRQTKIKDRENLHKLTNQICDMQLRLNGKDNDIIALQEEVLNNNVLLNHNALITPDILHPSLQKTEIANQELEKTRILNQVLEKPKTINKVIDLVRDTPEDESSKIQTLNVKLKTEKIDLEINKPGIQKTEILYRDLEKSEIYNPEKFKTLTKIETTPSVLDEKDLVQNKMENLEIKSCQPTQPTQPSQQNRSKRRRKKKH